MLKKTQHIDIYKGFGSFTEILDWLKADWRNRHVKYDGDKELAVFLSWNPETKDHDAIGSNSETFHLVDRWYDEDPETSSLEEYFDRHDKPMNKKFARDFDLTKFVGEEYVAD